MTKMGYNQTRVCRPMACPSGASDNVLSSPHGSYPTHSTMPTVTACQFATVCSIHCPFLEPVIPIITVVSSFLCKGFPTVWSQNLSVVCLTTSVSFGEHSGEHRSLHLQLILHMLCRLLHLLACLLGNTRNCFGGSTGEAARRVGSSRISRGESRVDALTEGWLLPDEQL